MCTESFSSVLSYNVVASTRQIMAKIKEQRVIIQSFSVHRVLKIFHDLWNEKSQIRKIKTIHIHETASYNVSVQHIEFSMAVCLVYSSLSPVVGLVVALVTTAAAGAVRALVAVARDVTHAAASVAFPVVARVAAGFGAVARNVAGLATVVALERRDN